MNDTRPAVTEVQEWPARALWRNPPTGRSDGANKDTPGSDRGCGQELAEHGGGFRVLALDAGAVELVR